MDGPLKCVWMLAGVIDYRLCDRRYDCAHCTLDQAIRGRGPVGPPAAGNEPFQAAAGNSPAGPADVERVQGYALSRSVFYDPCHVWVRVEGGGKVRMGLDDLAQRLLGRVYSFSLPKVGVMVSPQRRGWAIAHASGETALRIPVAGRVIEVSEKLMELPSLANRDPYGQGAAFVVEPRDLAADLKPLHYGNDARLWYEREIERLTRELQERPTPEIGVTFQDGGEPVEDLSRLLGAEKHRALIERFLTGGASHARPRSRREKGR